jgi:outer membrane lipoprotein-sorting protein
MKKFCLLIFLVTLTVGAQQINPDEILTKVKEKINKVNDYSVQANVKVDVDFLRVPETKATIYFKQPDKVKMESDGFALIPRQGFNFSPLMLLKEDYTAVFAKEDTLEGNEIYLIKILPLSDSTDVVLSNLWIDKNNFVVHKVMTTTKKSGTVQIDLKYDKQIDYALPSEMKISFNLDRMNIPQTAMEGSQGDQKSKTNKNMSGRVIVTYSNYNINLGLTDEFFIEENGKSIRK